MDQVTSTAETGRYLVGFVPNESGDDAVALGDLLASSSGGSLTISTVVPHTATGGDAAFGGPGYGDLVARKLQPVYEQVIADLAPRNASYSVRFAPSVGTGLMDYAAEIDATMLVLGSARSGISGRYSVGSVGGLLQHSSPVPLAFAPEGFAEVGVEKVERVVCGYNQSPDSAQALDAAVQLSRDYQVPLALVTFVFPDYPNLRHVPGVGSFDHDPDKQAGIARQRLADVVAGLPEDIQVETFVRPGGNIAQAVARAEWRDGDILVLGSAPMGPFARVFLGSTALKLLRCCPIPVIAVPRPDERTAKQRTKRGKQPKKGQQPDKGQ